MRLRATDPHGAAWSGGRSGDYDREFCIGRVQLASFLCGAQPEIAESLALGDDDPQPHNLSGRLQGQISKHGTIEV